MSSIGNSEKDKTIGSTKEYRESINKTLDQTRDNIRKSLDEARKNIPGYSHNINEYYEESLHVAKEIAENYLESQKEILNLLEPTWAPFSPKNIAESYVSIVSNLADSIISSTNSTNTAMLTNMNLYKSIFQQMKESSKETSRLCINSAKVFHQAYKAYYN